MTDPKNDFLHLLRESVAGGALVKLTLGRYRGADPTLRNLHVRPVTLRAGPRLSFVWRHATRDITKNHPPAEALDRLAGLIGGDFGSAHLFTTKLGAQLEFAADGSARFKRLAQITAAATGEHDRGRRRLIPPATAWLQALGVTTPAGAVRTGMAAKYQQIHRFVELLLPLVRAAPLPANRPPVVADMGCGKGYLTFAAWQLFRGLPGLPARVHGVEARPELVELDNRTARECGCEGLEFTAGTIADTPREVLDVLIALHACDTATDDAIAAGIRADAALIVVAPCCHKELSPLLAPAPVLAPAVRHGIFHERQAEFVTDALRVLLLEWAGYETRAFEFIATEHTPKNLMIAAVRRSSPVGVEAAAVRAREFAAFYGVRTQHLARHLGFALAP